MDEVNLNQHSKSRNYAIQVLYNKLDSKDLILLIMQKRNFEL